VITTLDGLGGRRGSGRLLTVACLIACAGSGRSNDVTPPAEPSALTLDVGDAAVALGWQPPSNDGGAAVEGYQVTIAPAVPASDVQVSGTTALISRLANGTSYTFSVSARNRAGAGAATSVTGTPMAYSATAEAPLQIQGDASPSGIFDPSVIVAQDGTSWMAYSSVDYHLDAQNQRVQDVGIALARSDDGGLGWQRVRSVASPEPALVTDTIAGHPVCGAVTCAGRWVYETAWLVEDPTDVAGRRFKLFAHRYFLYPPAAAGGATVYVLGAIVLWTAATPDQLGASPPVTALRWSLTPPELPGGIDVNGLSPELAGCLAVAEGSAAVHGGVMDLVLACTYPAAGASPLPQKIVLLRSADHAQSFAYVATLLDAPDAAPLGADFYTAPSIFSRGDAAPVLLATPAFSGIYGGCAAIPFADVEAGTLTRVAGLPAIILFVPTGTGTFGGACAMDRALTSGILRNQVELGSSWPPTFQIIRTGRGI
jgi:hypothetical protein